MRKGTLEFTSSFDVEPTSDAEGNSGFPSSHSIIICDRSCIPTQESLKKYILSVCGSLDYANEIGYGIMFPDTPGECVYMYYR